MGGERVAVYVSGDLYDEVKRRIRESSGEFKSVDDYVEFVLRETVKEEERETYTKEEEEEIKRRLKSLGYL